MKSKMEDRKRIVEIMVSKGLSYSEIGEALGVSKQRVHQICEVLGIVEPKKQKTISGRELRQRLKEKSVAEWRPLSESQDRYERERQGCTDGADLRVPREQKSKLDIFRVARRIIRSIMKAETPPGDILLHAKVPKELMERFKALPGRFPDNMRAALELMVIATRGPRRKGGGWRLYIGGIPRLQEITYSFIIERPRGAKAGSLEYQGLAVRISSELWEDFNSLPGIRSQNVERAMKLFLSALIGRKEP
jgi:hypothetical protein